MAELKTMHHGARGDGIRRLQRVTNGRLEKRGLSAYKVREDGVLGVKTLLAVRKAAWALGALEKTLQTITSKRVVPTGVQGLILNPGHRSPRQLRSAKARITQLKRDRARREAELKREREHASKRSKVVAAVYHAAGLPSPASPLPHQWASTYSIAKSPRARVTTHPRPGDLGMYGSRWAPHHVEIYIGEPGQEFIGHGSPPIDSLTPGRPSFYLTFDFLD